MNNYSAKKYRGKSKLFIEGGYPKSNRPTQRKAQCRACKHKFNVTDIDHKDCPKCGCEQTSIIR